MSHPPSDGETSETDETDGYGEGGYGSEDYGDTPTTAMSELTVRTDGSASIDYFVTVSEQIQPVEGTTGASSGDYISDDGHTAGGSVTPTDEFDSYTFTGEIIGFSPSTHAGLSVLVDDVEVDPAELGGSEPDPDPTAEERRWYIYGDDWQGQNSDPIYYTFAVDGYIETDEKADEYDTVEEFRTIAGEGTDDEERSIWIVSGSVPANSDDAFRLWGEILWAHGSDRLNFQLAREEYEPPRRTQMPDETGSLGPEKDLAQRYDHYVEVDAAGYGGEVRYHLVATGEIAAASTGDAADNRGWFGHADGHVSGETDGYYFDGSLLNVFAGPSLGRWRKYQHNEALGVYDLPYRILVDGVAIDHNEFDPRTRDAGTPLALPMGYRPDGLPSQLVPDRSAADHLIASRDDLESLTDSRLQAGDVVLVTDTIALPQIDGRYLQWNTNAITLACEPGAGLESATGGVNRWGNIALRLTGNYVTTIGLQLQGGERVPTPYTGTAAKGIEFAGRYPVALNIHAWHWGQDGVACRGLGETVMCVDAHHCQTDGSGYGVSSSGPVSVKKNWDLGEVWSDDELATVRDWHERTSIKLFRLDANRHSIERGTNTSTEAGFGVIGPTARHNGTQDDTHRPGAGTERRHNMVVMRPRNERAVGGWVRGRPSCFQLANVWFEGWDQARYGSVVDIESDRHRDRGAPFAQACATDDVYNNRNGFDRSSGPFAPKDTLAWQFDENQIGGTRPDWLSQPAYDALSFFRAGGFEA